MYMNVLENPFGPLMNDPELIKKIEKPKKELKYSYF